MRRRVLAIMTLAVTLGTGVALADADPLKFSAVFLETAPLKAFGPGPYTYEASLVNVGPNAATGFILFCESSTGTCATGVGCAGSLLDPGEGCSASGSGESGDSWARLVLIRFGDKKPIDARGALQVQFRTAGGEGFASEAVPRPGTVLVTEAPAR